MTSAGYSSNLRDFGPALKQSGVGWRYLQVVKERSGSWLSLIWTAGCCSWLKFVACCGRKKRDMLQIWNGKNSFTKVLWV